MHYERFSSIPTHLPMSTFKNRLLTDLSGLCRELFSRRLQLVRQQQLVSEKAKEDIRQLILELHALSMLEPFPREEEADLSPLEELKASLADTDNDPEGSQEVLMAWVKDFRPPQVAAMGRPSSSSSEKGSGTKPVNQRMIDGVNTLRSTIDKTRTRLMLDGESYDRQAYVAARNEFTLAQSVYTERLQFNHIICTNEELSRVERVLLPGIDEADGDGFPDSIQVAADFMAQASFPTV
jgi:hypothetical protein